MQKQARGRILWTMLAKGLSKTRVKLALRAADWVVADAASSLGVSRQAVYLAIERFGIKRQPQPDLGEKRRRAALASWRSRTRVA